jgi:selenocysteine lyase/cysteine desulfurase
MLEWTASGIAHYIRTLSAPVVEAARELGFGVEEDQFRSPHLFGLKMPAGVELADLREALAQANVFVSLRGSSLRVSPHVYNTEDDVAALERVLREIVAG